MALRRAFEERLSRVRQIRSLRATAERLLEIGAHSAALPDVDVSTLDEILGYAEHGAPT